MFDVGAVHSGSCLQYVCASVDVLVCVCVRVLIAAVVDCGGFVAKKNPCPDAYSQYNNGLCMI